MGKKSFTVVFENTDPEPGFDGLALLKNNASATSGVQVAVTDVRVYFPTGFNSDQTNLLGNQGILSLERITATSGGTAVAASKFDTGASSLPGQVTFNLRPDSVTTSATLRRFGDAYAYTILLANNFGSFRAPSVLDSNDHSGRTSESHDVWHADGVSDTEPIVLREGEGVAVVKRAFGIALDHHWQLIVKVASTGNSYMYSNIEAGDPGFLGAPIWSLFNASGSGVVLHVMIVSKPDLGESNIPKFRLVRAWGVQEGGVAVTPVAHDTANTLSELLAVKGEFKPTLSVDGLTTNYWNYQGSPVSVIEQQRVGLLRNFMVGTIWTETAPPNYRCYMPDEIWPGERRMASGGGLDSDSILLNPGECLAVIGGLGGAVETSQAGYVNVEMVGYVITPTVSVGASPAHIVSGHAPTKRSGTGV